MALRAAAAGGLAAALTLASVPPAVAATVRPGRAGAAVALVHGMDVSAYQHAGASLNWALLARSGVRFTAIKAAEGTYYVNPYYRSDARAAARFGLATLPYTFANPGSASGQATASFALRAVGSARGDLPLVLDLENDPYQKDHDCYGLRPRAMTGWIAGFVAKTRALTGRAPVIYTTAAWWDECTADSARFRSAPLWLAAFNGTAPTPPPAWPAWTFLQYSNTGTLPGIEDADLDTYHPTAALPRLTAAPARRPHRRTPRRQTAVHVYQLKRK